MGRRKVDKTRRKVNERWSKAKREQVKGIWTIPHRHKHHKTQNRIHAPDQTPGKPARIARSLSILHTSCLCRVHRPFQKQL